MSNPVSPTLPLADLHLPTEPGLFPLAWGWWLVIALAFTALLAGSYWLIKKIKRQRAKKIALCELKACRSIAEINLLLKRAALSYYPKNEVAGLTSGAWLNFLDDKLPASERGFVQIEQAWQQAAFSNQAVDPEMLTTAKTLAKKWLTKGLTHV